MGIYSTKYLLEEDLSSVQDPDSPGVDLDQIENDIVGDDGNEAHNEEIEDAVEGVIGDSLEEAYQIMYESEYNYNMLLQAIGMQELKEAVSGKEYIMEAGSVSAFFGRVKEIFVNMFKKITEFFKKVFNSIRSRLVNDKKFISMYESDIRTGADILKNNGKLKDKEGYSFDGIKEIPYMLSNVYTYSSNASKDISGDFDIHKYTADASSSEINKLFSDVVKNNGASDKVTSISELNKVLTKKFYGNKIKVFDGDLTADGVIKVLKDNSDTSKLQKAYNEIKKSYSDTISGLKKMEKDATKETKSNITTICNYYIGILRQESNINNSVFTSYTKAAKARRNQARKLANSFKAASGNTKSDDNSGGTKTESTIIFGHIDFI